MTLFDLSLPLFFCSSLGLGWYFSSVSFLLYPGFPLCPLSSVFCFHNS